jgi:hypothetical protein
MSTPNWQHNSGKDPKRKLKPRKLKDRRQALQALLRKLNFDKNDKKNVDYFIKFST